jgi:hypothetical protein
MIRNGNGSWNRRSFVKTVTTAAASTALPLYGLNTAEGGTVALVVNPADTVAASPPVMWALDHLTRALTAKGIAVRRISDLASSDKVDLILIAASSKVAMAAQLLSTAGVSVADVSEALALVSRRESGQATLLACGHDARGLVFALTEVADVVANAPNAMTGLTAIETKAEQPANQVRSMTRLFCSEPEDKPWYNDREMWPQYFDMLVSQRFNRFNLAFGIGYDFIRKVTDAYFLFTYPFLLKVPGYNVRVPQLADAERERNLEMLKYISEQCVARGIEFHVGLWMHGYVWIDSPDANYTIEGLDKTTHGPYCRDAVRMLLKEVPNIQGLTFRIHGESGVEEGSFEFWKTVFDGVKTCGRRMPIDMHTKGMSQQMIDIALDTQQPLQMSPKYWGEHMGMPYHQADIRELEKPKEKDAQGLMALSSGTRAFLRYGYGDLLPEDRKWTVVHRIWPGTQRVLLWGDPVFAAAYSRSFSFCGSNGVEIQEMLSFKGRRGSGHAGNRCAYLDDSYKVRWDWQKYEYGTRVWGRLLYNPETKPEVTRRTLIKQFGPGALAMEIALANVSRILPIITTAHAASAGNNTYWPELYFNQSMVDAEHFGPYRDSPQPRVFGAVSPLDPELFYTINDFTDDLLASHSNGKYTPLEVAQWIEDYAGAGRMALAQADASAIGRGTAAYRRAKVDILIQVKIGEFFAAKLRSGVLYRIFEKTKDRAALDASIKEYQIARSAWADAAKVGTGIYMTDITLGEEPQLRGHWADRLPAMDADIAALLAIQSSTSSSPKAASAIQVVQRKALRFTVAAKHVVPIRFTPGEALELKIAAPVGTTAVLLHYRHVDQAENYQTVTMKMEGAAYTSMIPAVYTKTKFPLEYFFEVRAGEAKTGLYPGFAAELTNQPYFVVRSV